MNCWYLFFGKSTSRAYSGRPRNRSINNLVESTVRHCSLADDASRRVVRRRRIDAIRGWFLVELVVDDEIARCLVRISRETTVNSMTTLRWRVNSIRRFWNVICDLSKYFEIHFSSWTIIFKYFPLICFILMINSFHTKSRFYCSIIIVENFTCFLV